MKISFIPKSLLLMAFLVLVGFTVSCDLSMNRLAEIRIKSGSTLIVEGVIRNANIQAEPGSTIILNNGGQIITHKNDDFVVPIGAILQMNNGKII